MSSSGSTKQWNLVAKRWPQDGYYSELLAEHFRGIYLGLVDKWADLRAAGSILKTDLFDVAFGPVPFLFDIARINGNIIGIDISSEVVNTAREQARGQGIDTGTYICCDVRHIPLQSHSIDLIISDSTLDHFSSEADILDALKELRRILSLGGILILSMDNSSNVTYPPYPLIRLWMRLGLAPYFIGRTLSPRRTWQVLEDIGFTVEAKTAIYHCPHPDILVRWLEGFLRRVSGGRFDNIIRKTLHLTDRLEGRRTEYLTGRYIAVKAVKR